MPKYTFLILIFIISRIVAKDNPHILKDQIYKIDSTCKILGDINNLSCYCIDACRNSTYIGWVPVLKNDPKCFVTYTSSNYQCLCPYHNRSSFPCIGTWEYFFID